MDTSRQPRGKVPEYPRPVPDIDADEIPTCEDTIIYNQWTDDADWVPEERAVKRQKRRREVAEAYLRGDDITILTASLRGPFEGWQNPWGRNYRKVLGKRAREVPETRRRTLQRDKELSKSGRPSDTAYPGRSDVVEDLSRLRDAPVLKMMARDSASVNNTNLGGGVQVPASTERIEEWLKTSDAHSRMPTSHIGSSPTPLPRPAKVLQNLGQADKASPNSTRCHGVPLPDPQTLETGDGLPPVASQSGTASSGPTHESPRRAEAAILEDKRTSVRRIPPSTTLPAFEYRRGRKSEKQDDIQQSRAEPELVDEPQSAVHVPPTSRRALSAETSKPSTVHNLPSAQVAPAVRPVVSNAHSTEELLEELPSASRSGAQNERPRVDPEQLPYPGPSGPSMPNQAQFGVDTPIRDPETQEMIAAIKPFEFSTIKKPVEKTPVTARQAASARTRKQASFGVDPLRSDDSQTSIKASLKIKKTTAPAANDKGNDKVVLFGDPPADSGPGLDIVDDNVHSETLPSLSTMFVAKKASAPKSILKSSNAQSTALGPSGDTPSTFMKQDAQVPVQQAGQNAIEYNLIVEDDGFDVDAAMDQLGSYLGTWDPEAEASEVAAAT